MSNNATLKEIVLQNKTNLGLIVISKSKYLGNVFDLINLRKNRFLWTIKESSRRKSLNLKYIFVKFAFIRINWVITNFKRLRGKIC